MTALLDWLARTFAVPKRRERRQHLVAAVVDHVGGPAAGGCNLRLTNLCKSFRGLFCYVHGVTMRRVIAFQKAASSWRR